MEAVNGRFREHGTEVWRKYLELAAGTMISVLGLQLFITPAGLYNGGTIGVSQIIRTLLTEYLGLSIEIDLAGVINLVINIPLMVMAYFILSRRFFLRTAFVMAVQTIAISAIHVGQPIISDRLTSCLVGGMVAGVGCGMILRAGGSGAGFDIIGVWLARTRVRAGVGTLTTFMNACVYLACAALFSLPTAIYSIIYAVFSAMMIDRVHTQNISCGVIIISRKENLHQHIMAELERGVTYWKGSGGQSGEGMYIYYTVVSKYEEILLRRLLWQEDEHAFIVVDENQRVYGNFIRRLN